MEITSLLPSTDRSSLQLTITDAASATSLLLFTNQTYKDYNKSIDLSAKLDGQAAQTITISLSDLKQSYLDGLYFVQLESPTDICTAISLDSTRYRECILDQVLLLDTCDSCLKEESAHLLRSEALLKSLEICVSDGFVEEAFNIIKALDKYCSDSCKSCGQHNNVQTTNYFTSNSGI